MNGLLTTLNETKNKTANFLLGLPLVIKLLMEGLVLTVILVAFKNQISGAEHAFIAYMPPIGFALMVFTTYLVQPLILGVMNIFLISILFGTRGWQVGFWLNGIFLVLVFSTINLVMQTSFGLSDAAIAVIDLVVLSLPFGSIARFSNGGWKKPIN